MPPSTSSSAPNINEDSSDARKTAVLPMSEGCPILPSNDKKKVSPVFVFNPYLEAPFGAAVFTGMVNKLDSKLKYGIQTNCMTCHSFATASGVLPYSTDQYVNMKDTIFKNQVQLDFAWSIQAAIINYTVSTKKAKK